MTPVLLAFAILLISGIAPRCVRAGSPLSRRVGPAGVTAAAALTLIPAVRSLAGSGAVRTAWAWGMPSGSLAVNLDPLAAFFLIPVVVLSAASAWAGSDASRGHDPGRAARSWLPFNVLVAAMIGVCLADNALFFLLAWETMALSSFFLVATDHGDEGVRRAAWIYLAAAHVGTAFLIPMFLSFAKAGGSADFAAFSGALAGPAASAAFVCAVIGFGAKAGFVPLHVWLPDAHPAAPSHVSALMSGVMIKTGLYGLIRVVSFLGTPPAWWGWTLTAVGAVSALTGVLFALAQRDLKRLLAYSSIENIGIICLSLGVGLVGRSAGLPLVSFLGIAAALVHTVNHAAFKGTLFLAAGSAVHAAGTREMDRLGGLSRRMPRTGAAFLAGSVAASGLPPFAGFTGEFLLLAGLWRAVTGLNPSGAAAMAGAAAAFALVAGFSLTVMVKAFGVCFLGEPRSAAAAGAAESGASETVPMAVLAAFCVLGGLLWSVAFRSAVPAAAAALGPPPEGGVAEVAGWLRVIAALSLVLAASAGGLALLRVRLLRRGPSAPRRTATWDCGYRGATPRMQYTGSSFVQPATDLFGFVLGTRKNVRRPEGYFPAGRRFESETPDVSRERLYRPAIAAAARIFSRFRAIQEGRLQVYVAYMVLTLLALLLWQLG
jgi:hydrogenase-4 component B